MACHVCGDKDPLKLLAPDHVAYSQYSKYGKNICVHCLSMLERYEPFLRVMLNDKKKQVEKVIDPLLAIVILLFLFCCFASVVWFVFYIVLDIIHRVSH